MSAVANTCPDCGGYAHECVCVELDEVEAIEQLADYTCYACGAPATGEIQHRGGWLDVCDDPSCVGEDPRPWWQRDADDAGQPAQGPL